MSSVIAAAADGATDAEQQREPASSRRFSGR
jgi:hypothetical protein